MRAYAYVQRYYPPPSRVGSDVIGRKNDVMGVHMGAHGEGIKECNGGFFII